MSDISRINGLNQAAGLHALGGAPGKNASNGISGSQASNGLNADKVDINFGSRIGTNAGKVDVGRLVGEIAKQDAFQAADSLHASTLFGLTTLG